MIEMSGLQADLVASDPPTAEATEVRDDPVPAGPRPADRAHVIFLWIMVPIAVVLTVVSSILFANKNVEASVIALFVAGYAMCCSIILTAILVAMHLYAFTNPVEQRFIIRIIVMCPIYAMDSFLALQFYHLGVIIAVIRDTYEGYVIFQFFQLLLAYGGGDRLVVQEWAVSKPTMQHPWPFGRLTPVNLNQNTLDWWKWMVTQYAVINPLLTLITIPLYFIEQDGKPIYEEGRLDLGSAYFWIAGIRFWSVGGALTALLYFLFAVEPQIPDKKPEAKFLAVKAVVFATFWQSVLFAGLSHYKVIQRTNLWSKEEVATGLNNFCVCCEMFFVSIIHRWVFSDSPYLTEVGRYPPNRYILKYLFNIDDVTRVIQSDLIQFTGNKVRETDRLIRNWE